MSIKPIDMQVIVQRSTDVARVKSDEQTRNQQIAQAGAQDVQKKADEDAERVHTQAKIQEAAIQNKQEKQPKRRGSPTYTSKKQKRNATDNETKTTTDEKTSSIDIRI